ADPVVLEVGLGDAVEPAIERSVGAARELAAPPEAELADLVERLEGNMEPVGLLLDLEIRDLRRDRAPARVADGDEQPPDRLDTADPRVAEIDPLQPRSEGAGPELPGLDRRLAAAVPNLEAGRLAHRGARSYSPPYDGTARQAP